MSDFIEKLRSMHACPHAIVWLRENGFTSLQSAWDVCERGDWMLWLVGKTTDRTDDDKLRVLILAKARCAKLVFHLMRDERSRNAVNVAEAFGLGLISRADLDAAASDAAAAADSAAIAYTSTSDLTAAYAAAAAAAAASDAYSSSVATYAASANANSGYAGHDILLKCAHEIRAVIPVAPEINTSDEKCTKRLCSESIR